MTDNQSRKVLRVRFTLKRKMDLKIFLFWLKLLLFCVPILYHITSETKRVEGPENQAD